ncbi:MAG: hypothetical protein IT168_12270 [Bryobacterales bacterium]|nr:hypothetical protein [Bryobacterales bacterium]
MSLKTLPSKAQGAPESGAGQARRVDWAHAEVWGLRVAALFEIAAMLAGALGVDAWLETGRFSGVEPHPFLFVVLIAAAHYGLGEGLIAAALAAVALRAGNLPPATGGDAYDYLWACVVQPFGWLVLAVVVGAVRNYHRGRQRKIEADLEESLRRERELSSGFDHVRRVKRRLEEAVASHLRSAVSLYGAAQHIERSDPLEVIGGARALIEAGLDPSQYSLYLLDGDRLVCVLSEGHEPGCARWVYDRSTPLFARIVEQRLTACVARPAEAGILAEDGVIAGPLISDQTGEVVGMLKIEQIGFISLSLAAVQNFEVICRWVGTAFAKAQQHMDGHVSAYFNANTQILSFGMFEQQSLFVTRIARRLNFDLSLLAIRLEVKRNHTAGERSQIAQALGGAVRSVLRTTDLAFEAERVGYGYTILLPNTSEAGAQVVAGKLLSELERRLPSAFRTRDFQIRVESLHSRRALQELPSLASAVSRLSETVSGAASLDRVQRQEAPSV